MVEDVVGVVLEFAVVLELTGVVAVLVPVAPVVAELATVRVLTVVAEPPQAARPSAASSVSMATGTRIPFFSSPDASDPACASSNLDSNQSEISDPAGAWLAKHDPFWGPQLVAAAAILLDLALPEKLTIRPTWLLPALEGLALAGLILASPHPRMRHSPLRRHIAIALIGLVSAANTFSLVLLCHFLLHGGKSNGRALIGSGIVLWVTNVLLFGLWYWQLDRGGPLARALEPQPAPDFLFVQMTEPRWAPADWRPGLVDYLYTSFTNATAFSPTDTMPLTPTAKWLMSAQALTALLTIGLVVARAVNILS